MTVQAIQTSANMPSGTHSRATLDTYQFLRLLIVELTSQNPMDPVKDRDFLAQMAQLNTAQQMERMGTLLTTLQSANLIGREVEVVLPSGARLTGKVQSVQLSAGQVFLLVEDQRVPFSAIQTIR